MSKKDKSQVIDGQVMDPTAEGVADEEAQAKLEKSKQQKKEAAKRFHEKRAAEKKASQENASAYIEFCKSNGTWDTMDDKFKKWFSDLANPVSASGNEPVFGKLFGANPQVGDSITMRDVFEKTLKGKSNIDNLCKKWAEKGIIVSYKANPEDITLSTYTIESLGA